MKKAIADKMKRGNFLTINVLLLNKFLFFKFCFRTINASFYLLFFNK